MRNLITLSAVLFLGLASPARADPIPMPPELRAFLQRPEQRQAVKDLMERQWTMVVENCASPPINGVNVMISIPPKFNTDGVPTSGDWLIAGHLEGCGEARIFTIEYLFAPDGQMRTIALLPGTTHANLRLQKDALKFAMMGMIKLAPKDCKDFKFIDTKFIEYASSTAVSDRRPWNEEWTVRACGVTGIVPMNFTPDATGTNITTTPNRTRRVGP